MRVLIAYSTLLQPTVQQHKQKHKHSFRCAPLTDRNLSECVCVCARSLVSMVSRRHTHLCCMNRDKDTLDMYLHIHIHIYVHMHTHTHKDRCTHKTDAKREIGPKESQQKHGLGHFRALQFPSCVEALMLTNGRELVIRPMS